MTPRPEPITAVDWRREAIEALDVVARTAAERDAAMAELMRMRWCVVANAGRLSQVRRARWAHVAEATGIGSTSATALCVAAGFDPDEVIGGGEDA